MKPAQFTVTSHPAIDGGGTVDGVISAARLVAGSLLLTATLPAGLPREPLAGRYFLVRCAETTEWARSHDWTFALRRPLFVAGWHPPTAADGAERWLLTSPQLEDPGVGWLAARPTNAPVNLVGPLGNGFALPPRTRQLAIVSEPARVAALLPLIHAMLDRGGRVVILLLADRSIAPPLRDLLPLATEVHQEAPGKDWRARLQDALAWADIVATALPARETAGVLEAVRMARLRMERGLVHCLVDAPLMCGYGACLACLTPLASGRWTRACVHGPVFDLADLSAG
jgi:dihydroorotate dehydrogenase electron transfer subunit